MLVMCICLPDRDDRHIRLETFEVATQMARGHNTQLGDAVLASIFHGLNKIVDGDEPSSGGMFPAHYLYVWLAHYFETHHTLDDVPFSPLMVQYSGNQGAKPFTGSPGRKLEGKLFAPSR